MAAAGSWRHVPGRPSLPHSWRPKRSQTPKSCQPRMLGFVREDPLKDPGQEPSAGLCRRIQPGAPWDANLMAEKVHLRIVPALLGPGIQGCAGAIPCFESESDISSENPAIGGIASCAMPGGCTLRATENLGGRTGAASEQRLFPWDGRTAVSQLHRPVLSRELAWTEGYPPCLASGFLGCRKWSRPWLVPWSHGSECARPWEKNPATPFYGVRPGSAPSRTGRLCDLTWQSGAVRRPSEPVRLLGLAASAHMGPGRLVSPDWSFSRPDPTELRSARRFSDRAQP